MKRWLIVGGGFRGIVAAHHLRKAGHSVTLVERLPFLGGVLHSDEWNGVYLDKGCHLFGNNSAETTRIILEMMDGDVLPVHVKYAAVTEGRKSDGLVVPDFTVLDPARQREILYQVIEAAAAGPAGPADNLFDHFVQRYGPLLAEHLACAARKMLRIDPSELEADAVAATSFTRVRVLPDGPSELLKGLDVFDERLAASSQDDPLKYYREAGEAFPYRSFYPRDRGMLGFCERALGHLRGIGVNVVLGAAIEKISHTRGGLELSFAEAAPVAVDSLLWAIDAEILMRILYGDEFAPPPIHRVPMVLYYFAVPRDRVGDYTYIQDYTEDHLVYRASAQGVYSEQALADGSSVVCFEVPTELGSRVWSRPEDHLDAVWREGVALGMVRGRRPRRHTVMQTPMSYKVPKCGFNRAIEAMTAAIAEFSDRIVVANQTAVSKIDIMAALGDVE